MNQNNFSFSSSVTSYFPRSLSCNILRNRRTFFTFSNCFLKVQSSIATWKMGLPHWFSNSFCRTLVASWFNQKLNEIWARSSGKFVSIIIEFILLFSCSFFYVIQPSLRKVSQKRISVTQSYLSIDGARDPRSKPGDLLNTRLKWRNYKGIFSKNIFRKKRFRT